jgi:hypothetical protein
MNPSVPRSWAKLCAALCAAALIFCQTSPAFAATEPWYKRLFGRSSQKSATPIPDPSKELPRPAVRARPAAPAVLPAKTATQPAAEENPISSYKEKPDALEVDDSLKAFTPKPGDEEEPDLSKERTPADDLLKREFPMPQEAPPEAPRLPPTPDRYAPPAAAPAAPAHAAETRRAPRSPQ